MKRKTKRTGKKKWVSFITPFGAILAFIGFLTGFLNKTIIPILIAKIKLCFSINDGSNLPLLILFCFSLAIIILLSFIVSRLYLNINKPNRKYFELIDFKKPTDDVIKNAAEGILNSEKTQPYFVHVAPVNDEIEEFYKKLDTAGFVWENGKPGDGKSMLAYNALFRYRKKVSLTFDITTLIMFKLKYKIYAFKLKNVSDEKEIDAILDELDFLKGGKRKIILIDDAHKLSFESKLRWELEEEARENLNGKFVWINTNYLDSQLSDKEEFISISFEKFYPKLLKELYGSQHPIIKNVVKNSCIALQEAIRLKEEGKKIKDPWHFNFIATNGEKRILDSLLKLNDLKEKQDILVLSVFLFSCRNIITGEKEINQTEFANLLTRIKVTYFKKGISTYPPNIIISDLASQDRGRFLIIDNKNYLDRGFLRAPHFKLSIAIIKSVVSNFSEDLIKQILTVSKLLLTDKFSDCKYFGIYFNSLGNYQEYFLNENRDWIQKFLTNLHLNQLHVYPFLLSTLKRHHNNFYKELITDDFFIKITSVISLAPATRFTSIKELIRVLGDDKEKLTKYLNWEKLANAANNAEVANFAQLETILNASRNDKKKLTKYLNWEKLANKANNAEVAQLKQVADFINASGNDKEKLTKYLNWEKLANKANNAEVAQLKQVADFINALGNDKEKLTKYLNWEKLANKANNAEVANFGQLEAILTASGNDKEKLTKYLNWEKLANTANNAEVANFSQLGAILNASGNDKEKLAKYLNWEKLANTANNAEVANFAQLEAILNASGNDKEKLTKYLNWEKLANTANNAEVDNFAQLEAILNALGNDKEKLTKYLNWEKLANTANKAEVTQIRKVADFINALGNDKEKISALFDDENIIRYFKNTTWKEIYSLCIILASIETEKQNSLIIKCNWISILNKINLNHSVQIKSLLQILNYQNKKQIILNLPLINQEIIIYIENNKEKIVHFSTQYFISPDDFRTCTSLLDLLMPYSLELCRNIANKIKNKIIRDFEISPRYYQSFSNLLNTINQINPAFSKDIIVNNLVKSKLLTSLEDKCATDQLDGLQSLLATLKNINPMLRVEILSLQLIKDLKLHED